MARLFTTSDYYTDYTSYDGIDSIISGSVYDPTTTSYNITLRSTPLCFYTSEQFQYNISIKDNSGLFTIESGTNYNMICTTIPVIGQTTELLVHNDDIDNIKVAPESIVNALYNVASPDCDGDPTFCIDNTEIENFCSIQGYGSSTTTGTDIKTFSSIVESYEYNEELGLPDFYPILYSSLTFAGFTLLVYVCYGLFRRFLSSK